MDFESQVLLEQAQWSHVSIVSCQKGPTCHAYAWQIGPFWQDNNGHWRVNEA